MGIENILGRTGKSLAGLLVLAGATGLNNGCDGGYVPNPDSNPGNWWLDDDGSGGSNNGGNNGGSNNGGGNDGGDNGLTDGGLLSLDDYLSEIEPYINNQIVLRVQQEVPFIMPLNYGKSPPDIIGAFEGEGRTIYPTNSSDPIYTNIVMSRRGNGLDVSTYTELLLDDAFIGYAEGESTQFEGISGRATNFTVGYIGSVVVDTILGPCYYDEDVIISGFLRGDRLEDVKKISEPYGGNCDLASDLVVSESDYYFIGN